MAGVTPTGDGLAVAPGTSGGLTLLAFLSTGCASCAGFWSSFRHPDRSGLPSGTRLVVITKGPDREIPAEVAALAVPGLSLVMSSDAWTDYEVPGSPFFVLVDGTSGRRIGEGVANHIDQVAELVRRAEIDAAAFSLADPGRPGRRDRRSGPRVGQRRRAPGGRHPAPVTRASTRRSLDDLYGPPDARMPAAPRPFRQAG